MQLLATSVTIPGMSLVRGGIRSGAWWVTAGLGVAVLALNIAGELELGIAGRSTVFYLVWMGVWTAIGLFVWAVRPDLRLTGPLWAWSGVLHMNENLLVAMPDSRFVVTETLLLLGMGATVQVNWALVYPAGRVYRRFAAVFLSIVYVGNVLLNIPYVLVHPSSYFYAPGLSLDITTYNRVITLTWLVPIALVVMGLFADRLLTVSPAARRSVGALMIAGLIHAPIWTFAAAQELWGTTIAWEVEQDTVILVTHFVFGVIGLSGLFFVKRARGNVGDLVVELNHVEPGQVRAALGRAVGDPTLEVGLWLPDRQAWVDERGEPLRLPPAEGRHATHIGDRLAVIVHDRDLVDQPALLAAAGSAARLALENARLQAELWAQLVELQESRARIVRAGDDERRRLERDLHDGAQQRLLALGMVLQGLRAHVDPTAEELLTETERELQQALQELRELAHGIHPAALTDNGLGDAVRTLALRAPVPVRVDVDERGGRLPGPVETAAYFVVAEALANVAKYADADEAWVTVGRENGSAHIEIRDNGKGGATPDAGTGLRGLADRVGALDGQLTIDSPPGEGTRIVAEIPSAS
jgi:signal transduction histidine kinase